MSRCSVCGSAFSCAMTDPGSAGACWCTELTALNAEAIATLAATTGGQCVCRACLASVSNPAAAASAATDRTT